MSIKSFYLNLLSSLILVALSTNSFGQNFQWAKQIGGAGWDEGTSIATDQSNNVYTVGFFEGTVDFDPGIDIFNLTSVGEKDAFICKLDAIGNFIWAKQYGDSAAIDENIHLVIDSIGNLYTTGSFLGTVDFNPGAGTFYLTSQGWDIDIFIQKLDINGNFIWAKQISEPFSTAYPSPTQTNAIAVDANGYVYTTGYFDGTIDFNPDTTSTFNLTAIAYSDIFINKLDSLGNFVWAKQLGGTQGEVGYALAVDENGNVYSTGTIGPNTTVDFDPGPSTYYLTNSDPFESEIYISKLNSTGNFVWAKLIGTGEGSAIALDDNGNAYTSGWFPITTTPVINKLDSSGNIIWAKQLGGINGKSIATDNSSNVYTTGGCWLGTKDFDPGPGVFNLTGTGDDSFISKLDSSGNFVWAGLLSGTGQLVSNSLAIDRNDNVYTTGYFDSTADFDPSTSIFNLTSIGYDIFIHKLSADTNVGFTENGFKEDIKIYPNPTEGNLIVEFDVEYESLYFVLRNVIGKVVLAKYINNNNRMELQINEESGIYLLEISDQKNHKAVQKIIKK